MDDKKPTHQNGTISVDLKAIEAGAVDTNQQQQRKPSIQSPPQLPDVPWYKSCRLILAFVSAWGYVFFYVLRIDLSLAIVCMVKDPSSGSEWQTTSNDSELFGLNGSFLQDGNWSDAMTSTTSYRSMTTHNITAFEAGDCMSTGSNTKKTRRSGELEWSKEMRGYILSSFFYGYLVTQVPGGWLASRYGGKHVYGTGMLITLLATLLIPVAARAHAGLLILLRVIMGLACGVGFPATHHLYGQWLPPLERSKLMAFSYAGTFIGTIIALFLSGFLCDSGIDNGWPLIFYVYGSVTFIWYILWNFFVYDSPATHPRIDPIEKEYIMKSIGSVAYEHNESIPWLSIIRSPAVWAIIISHACNNWANYTILMCTPMYMKEVLKFDIKQNGGLSALPHIVSYFGAVGSGQVADWLRRRQICGTTVTRKIFQCSSSAIPAAFIVSMGFIDCSLRYVAVVVLCLSLFFNSFCRSGFMVNHVDISPKHAGILFGISNTVATIPGILAPTVVGILTPNGSREEWMQVFFICGGFYVFSTVVYGILGEGTQQSWSKGNTVLASTAVEPQLEKIETDKAEKTITRL